MILYLWMGCPDEVGIWEWMMTDLQAEGEKGQDSLAGLVAELGEIVDL